MRFWEGTLLRNDDEAGDPLDPRAYNLLLKLSSRCIIKRKGECYETKDTLRNIQHYTFIQNTPSHTYTHKHVHIHTHTHMHAYTLINTHAHTHTNSHTQTYVALKLRQVDPQSTLTVVNS